MLLLPLQDAVVQLEFKLEGATTFHVGFDPAPGLVFRAGGKAGQEVLIDNVKVWELIPGSRNF